MRGPGWLPQLEVIRALSSDVVGGDLLNPHVTNVTSSCEDYKDHVSDVEAITKVHFMTLCFANLLYVICFVLMSVYCRIVELWLSSLRVKGRQHVAHLYLIVGWETFFKRGEGYKHIIQSNNINQLNDLFIF